MKIITIHFSIMALLLCSQVLSQTYQDNTTHNETSFFFLPLASISLDYSYLNTKAEFTGKQTKSIDVTLFSYSRYNLSMYVEEDIYTSERFNSRFYPYRIAYYMEYAYISYSFKHSQLGVVFDHTCYNTFDKEISSISNELRWYGIGIKWQSHGMKSGYFLNENVNESRIINSNYLHYLFYVGYPFMSKIPEYTLITRCTLRYDIPIFYYGIPYIETRIQCLVYPDNSIAIDRAFECGVKIPVSNVIIIPYSYYGYINDFLFPGIMDTQFALGVKAESSIGDNFLNDLYDYKNRNKNTTMHFSGGYAKNLISDYYNFTTDIGITIQSVVYKTNYVYLASLLNHNSRAQATALYPRFIDIRLETGIGLSLLSGHYAILGYQHYRRHDGNEFRGKREYYHSLEISLQHFYMSAKKLSTPEESATSSVYKSFEYALSLQYIVSGKNYPYSFIIKPKLYYYLSSFNSCIPYVGFDYTYYLGKNKNYEYSLEHGYVFTTTIPLIVYYAFKRDVDIDRIGGAKDFFHVIGIKLKI